MTALVSGLLFGLGLVISGMLEPATVIGFLDVTGEWNPALAFTMGGAIAVAAPAFLLVRHRAGAAGCMIAELRARRVDRRLVTGSAVFGVGWGLSGICPGPALILLTGGSLHAVVFVLSLTVGAVAARRLRGRSFFSSSSRYRGGALGARAISGSSLTRPR